MSTSKKSPKGSNFREKLIGYLQQFTEFTGIHGLRYLTERRSIVETTFWIIVLSVSLGTCIFMMSAIWTKYENDPVVVTFATKETPIYEIPFPAVTICSESKSSAEKFNFSEFFNKISSGNDSQLSKTDWQNFFYLSLLCENPVENGNATVGDDFFDTIEKLKPADNEDMVCSLWENTYNCSDIFTPIVTDTGICYSFNILDRSDLFKENVIYHKNFHNVGRNSSNYDADVGYTENAGVYTYPERALNSGADNSLTIYFAHNPNDTDYVCSKYLQGFRIMLHNPMDIPRLSKSYFRVPLNKVVSAAIKPELVTISNPLKTMSSEKRNCFLHNERPLKYFKIYTQSNCLLECLANDTLERCGCVGYFLPRFNDTQICGSGNWRCMQTVKTQLKIRELESKISKFINKYDSCCDCKPSCTDLSYNVEVSFTDFEWQDYFMAKPDPNFDGVQGKQLSVLSIYFKAEQFIPVERNEMYGLSDLISNFGGLLGLFTGFSLISLFEIIYFVTLRLVYNLRLYGRWWGLER